MSETTFFVRGKNRGNERRIILKSATLLVGRGKQKRLKLRVAMPLDGSKPVGTPDWIAEAYQFVSRTHDTVTPQVELSGHDITFDDEHLFQKVKAEAPKCQLKNFVIHEFGNAEDPEVEMQFNIYAPFSSKLLKFCGAFAGEEFWAKFEPVEEEADNANLELVGEPDEEEEDEEEEEPEEVEA